MSWLNEDDFKIIIKEPEKISIVELMKNNNKIEKKENKENKENKNLKNGDKALKIENKILKYGNQKLKQEI